MIILFRYLYRPIAHIGLFNNRPTRHSKAIVDSYYWTVCSCLSGPTKRMRKRLFAWISEIVFLDIISHLSHFWILFHIYIAPNKILSRRYMQWNISIASRPPDLLQLEGLLAFLCSSPKRHDCPIFGKRTGRLLQYPAV